MRLFLLVFIVACCSYRKPPNQYPLECSNVGIEKPLVISDTVHVTSRPIIKIQYHMILDSVDAKLSKKFNYDLLSDGTSILNSAYQNRISFIMNDSINYIYDDKDITWYYDDYVKNSMRGNELKDVQWTKFSQAYINNGFYNIFILKTIPYASERVLLGFTPVVDPSLIDSTTFNRYYNTVAISYTGFFKFDTGSALIHETGHWLGLPHPWELKSDELIKFGLDTELEKCINYMNYSCLTTEFTAEQIDYQIQFLQKYRSNLIN